MYFEDILVSISEFSNNYFNNLLILFSSNNALSFESLVNLKIFVNFPVLEFYVSNRSNRNVAIISINNHKLYAYFFAISL